MAFLGFVTLHDLDLNVLTKMLQGDTSIGNTSSQRTKLHLASCNFNNHAVWECPNANEVLKVTER